MFFSAHCMQVLLPSLFGWCFALWVVPLKSAGAVKDRVTMQYQHVVSSTRRPSDCAVGPFVPQTLEISGRGDTSMVAAAVWIEALVYLVWTDLQVSGFCCLNPALGPSVGLAAQKQTLKTGGESGLNSLPFHLTQICEKYLDKNSVSGVRLRGGRAVCFLSSPKVQSI